MSEIKSKIQTQLKNQQQEDTKHKKQLDRVRYINKRAAAVGCGVVTASTLVATAIAGGDPKTIGLSTIQASVASGATFTYMGYCHEKRLKLTHQKKRFESNRELLENVSDNNDKAAQRLAKQKKAHEKHQERKINNRHLDGQLKTFVVMQAAVGFLLGAGSTKSTGGAIIGLGAGLACSSACLKVMHNECETTDDLEFYEKQNEKTQVLFERLVEQER